MSAPKLSLALGGARKAPPPVNGTKRLHAALQDDDDEAESLGQTEVTHFDNAAGGAIDQNRRKADTGPLVIPKQSNRDWKEAANRRKRQKSGLPDNHDAKKGDFDTKIRDVEALEAAKKPGFGLNTFLSTTEPEEDVEMANRPATEAVALETNEEEEPAKPKTDDERAMDALLGKTTTDKTLTIAAAAEEPISEGDAFSHDFRAAPEMASLEQYAAMPVDQFGAALLRGMGWKDGEGIGSQRGKKLPKSTEVGKIPERRAALLGIGAKEDKAIAQEMGAWGRNLKKGNNGEVKIYNPVLLRDKNTGEMFTEEELQRKREREERERYEKEFERKEVKSHHDERRRDRDRSRDRDRRRHDGRGRYEDDRERSSRKHRDDGDGRRSDRDRHRDRDRRR